MPDNFYDLLEIDEDATADDVHAAYREKAREHHPDVNEDDRATRQFQVIKKAYEVLSSPDERERYDQQGHATYVRNNLGSLPGIEAPAGASPQISDTNTTPGGNVWSREQRQQSPGTTWYHGQRANPTHATRGSGGRRRSYYRTAPNRGPTPGWETITVFVGGLLAYAVGTWHFVTTNRPGITEFWEALTAAGADALITVITSQNFEIIRPLEFATNGLMDQSTAALFPIGGLVVAVASVIAAWEFQRHAAAVVALAGNGPLLILLVDYAVSQGILGISTGPFKAVGVTLLFLVVLPIGSLVVAGFLYKDAQD